MNKKVDEEYEGIKDVYILQCICSELKQQLQQKESIIKEVRKYIENAFATGEEIFKVEILEILDKEMMTY